MSDDQAVRALTPGPLPLLSRHGCPLASGGDTRERQLLAQVRESDDPGLSIGLAARRWPPGWDLIDLGQVQALQIAQG